MGLTPPHTPAAAFLMSSRARSCDCACVSVGIFACVRDDESWSHDSHTSAYVSKEGRVAERTEKRGKEHLEGVKVTDWFLFCNYCE